MIFLIALALAAPPSEGPPTPPHASGQQESTDRADPPVITPDPLTILMDFELLERDVVESAAKTRTTIQEAPSIITVVTQREIRDRGYRTLSDVLQNIPGFEGGRWEFNGAIKDNLTRGLPHTTLILLDGVNIVEPAQNLVVMDRKFPLDIVKRIEIISGPGGVLWGSNALLGVINIITHDGSSKPGFELTVGGGDGPGEQGAARAHLSYGGSFADDLVKLYISGTYFTTDGPSLELDGQKVIGPFPAPSPDAYSIYATGATTTEPVLRDHYLNISGNLEVGPVTLGWFTGYEVEYREISSGSVALTESYYDNPLATTDSVNNLVTAGSDQ
ncbi:MAG: outer membrane receptor protein involved in Fe transport, partial [Myxococcota bacterium]